MQPIPQTFDELIEQLTEAFPDRCPDIKDSERQIWFNAGCSHVVKHIQLRIDHPDEPENEINV